MNFRKLELIDKILIQYLIFFYAYQLITESKTQMIYSSVQDSQAQNQLCVAQRATHNCT